MGTIFVIKLSQISDRWWWQHDLNISDHLNHLQLSEMTLLCLCLSFSYPCYCQMNLVEITMSCSTSEVISHLMVKGDNVVKQKDPSVSVKGSDRALSCAQHRVLSFCRFSSFWPSQLTYLCTHLCTHESVGLKMSFGKALPQRCFVLVCILQSWERRKKMTNENLLQTQWSVFLSVFCFFYLQGALFRK